MRRWITIGMVAGVLAVAAGCIPMAQTAKQQRDWYLINNSTRLDAQTIADIEAGRIRIGMTDEQVRASWGLSKYIKINTTTTASGRHEQWCLNYRRGGYQTFLYFDNGILTCIQE